MTEDEAKTKWCPFALMSTMSNHSFNRMEERVAVPGTGAKEWEVKRGAPQATNCLASKCMAWRWHATVERPGEIPKPSEHGFCGLAGNAGIAP